MVNRGLKYSLNVFIAPGDQILCSTKTQFLTKMHLTSSTRLVDGDSERLMTSQMS
jgi:hypothetical protein